MCELEYLNHHNSQLIFSLAALVDVVVHTMSYTPTCEANPEQLVLLG